MDKVKQALAVAVKYHFWILCGIVAIMTLGSWYTSAATLRTQFADKKGKILAAEQKGNTLASEQNHPNEEYKQKMDEMINAYKASLRRLWDEQYESQGQNLQWPKDLTDEFVEQVKDLRPIETAVPYDPTNKGLDKLRGNYKEQYRDFVKSTELPRLAKMIDAAWHPDEMQGGTTRPTTGTEEQPEHMVEWHAENQEYLQNTRFDWSKEPTKLPSTLQILYAQEDLWVLGTLINIIAKTNQDANARHNAVVKEIKYLKLGQDAIGLSGETMRLLLVDPTGAAGGPTNPLGPTGAPVTGPVSPLGEGRPGVPGAIVTRDPAEGRYVDDKYQPVPPGRLREAFTSTKPEEAFLAVAKRMPVRMHLVVDQRYINNLLAECGNSNLIVEIRQIRVNRPVYEGGTSSGGGIAAGGPGRGEGNFGGYTPQRNPTGGGRGGDSGTGTAEEDEKTRHQVDIELYGIVYIYNPVNEGMVSAAGDAGAAVPLPGVPAPAAPAVPAPVPAAPAPAAPVVAPPANNEGAAPAPMPVVPPAAPAGA